MKAARLFVGLALICGTLAGSWWLTSRESSRKNVLFITVDTLRPDHLGAYGYPLATSPHIDALAERGVVFEQALAQSTLSGPSHATMMTSLHTPQHGVYSNVFRLSELHLTLAEVMRSAGYDTGMFVSHPLVGETFGLGQGFDTRELHELPSHLPGHPHPPLDDATPAPLHAVFDAVIGFLKRPRERPFFSWLHVQHVHQSYEPPPPFDVMFGDAPREPKHFLSCLRTTDAHHDGEITLSDAELDRVIALYDGEIAYVDSQLGRVFAVLEEADLMEETIVILVADHGEMLFDDPERRLNGHGRLPLEAVLRVPMIMKAPGASLAGLRSGALVGLIDLAPTILELTGQVAPKGFAGTSLVPLLVGEELVVRDKNFSCTAHSDGVARYSVRQDGYSLRCTARKEASVNCSLFDLSRVDGDHHEIEDEPERLLAMAKELESWFAGAQAYYWEMKENPPDGEALELLRRAGYLKDKPATGDPGAAKNSP